MRYLIYIILDILFIIYKVVKYRKILLIYILYILYFHYGSEHINSYIFTPQECTYKFLDYLCFSNDLLQCTSELQTPMTFLFVNEDIKCGYSFS